MVSLGTVIALIKKFGGGGGGGGSVSYLELTNKPKINGVTIGRDRSGAFYGLLDAPSTAGTLGQVLTSDGQGGQSWQTIEVSVVSPSSGTSFTLQPCPVTYAFGEKAELTVTVTATSQYHFSFSSPSATATVLTMTGITGTMGDTVEAGKDYEVDIWAGTALIKAVEVTPVT